MSIPIPTAPMPGMPAGAGTIGDLFAALGSPLAGAEQNAGFGELMQQALGKLTEKPAAPAKTKSGDEEVDTPDVEPVETPQAGTESLTQAVPTVPVAIPVVPVTEKVEVPLTGTQRPGGPDAQGPGVGVDGSGLRGARNERNGWLPAPGSGEGGSEGRGTPLPLEATPTPATTPPSIAVAPTSPTTSTTEAATEATSTTSTVRTQVIDEVTSLVSQGNGTHRITIRLNPEELGEVRVVMTVRDGAIHVRLAAGEHQTRTALVDSSPELHRLLELTGATDTKVTVRELGQGLMRDPGQGSGQGPGQSSGQNSGQGNNGWSLGSDQPSREHAGTRAHHQATDGDPTRPQQRPPVLPEHVAPSRDTGLDVTM